MGGVWEEGGWEGGREGGGCCHLGPCWGMVGSHDAVLEGGFWLLLILKLKCYLLVVNYLNNCFHFNMNNVIYCTKFKLLKTLQYFI